MDEQNNKSVDVTDLDGVQLSLDQRVLLGYIAAQKFSVVAGVNPAELQIIRVARKLFMENLNEDWSALFVKVQNRIRTSEFTNAMHENRHKDAGMFIMDFASEATALALKICFAAAQIRAEEIKAMSTETAQDSIEGPEDPQIH